MFAAKIYWRVPGEEDWHPLPFTEWEVSTHTSEPEAGHEGRVSCGRLVVDLAKNRAPCGLLNLKTADFCIKQDPSSPGYCFAGELSTETIKDNSGDTRVTISVFFDPSKMLMGAE